MAIILHTKKHRNPLREKAAEFSVVSKIVEKKNESKSQPRLKSGCVSQSCVKDRWEKEWKQITTEKINGL